MSSRTNLCMNKSIIQIDLNNFYPTPEVIGEFTLNKVIEKGFFIEKEVNCFYEVIEIINLVIPPSLPVDNPNDFITIKSPRLGLHSSRMQANIPIHTNGIKFLIEANIDKIQNVILGITNDKEDTQEIPISFTLRQQCAKYKIYDEKEYAFKILVKPAKAKLVIDYKPLLDQIEYEEAKNFHIGDLSFSFKRTLGYFYHESFRVNMSIEEGVDRKIIEVDLNNIRERLMSESSLNVPVYCRTKYLPDFSEEMIITVKINAEDPITSYAETEFNIEVLPDSTKTELLVEILDEDVLKNGASYQFKNNRRWLGATQKSKMTCFELLASNLAESGSGLIKIRSLEVKVDYDKSKIKLADGIDQVFELEKDETFELENKKQSVKKIARLMFRHSHIEEIKAKVLPVKVPVSFEYCFAEKTLLDQQMIEELSFCIKCYREETYYAVLKAETDTICPNCGSGKSGFHRAKARHKEFKEVYPSFLNDKTNNFESQYDWVPFNASISFNLEHYTGNSWLAIDFGTSASVVALADADLLQRGNDDAILVNMNKSLLKLYGQKFEEYSFSEDRNSSIISSEILFRSTNDDENKSFLDSKHYHEDVVQISPPKEILIENSHFSVPYLKSLIGFDAIPDINGSYKKLKYYINDQQPLPYTFGDRPLSVKEVLKNVYNSFLRDFIKPQVAEIEGSVGVKDKIIFTVPNTFTPKQVENIKNIIDTHFDHFKSDSIAFISESDAVACEYISNWHKHNSVRTDKETIRGNDEYIIVYDVGAGTTDLTLFKISGLNNNKERELIVLGKLGKGTAGNYLDYVIASVIDSINENAEKMTRQEGFNSLAHSNKNFIKNFVKPNLHRLDIQFYILPDGSLSEQANAEAQEVYVGQVIEHKLMEQYLNENSTEIIDQFFNLFAGTDPHVSAELKKSKLHTIIFSGRGVLFEKLRTSFEDAVRLFVSDEYQPYVIFNNDSEQLKSVVVKGALNYALEFKNEDLSAIKMRSKNLMARYGFLYKNHNGLWEFLEVLNPSTDSLNSLPHKVFGLSVYEYDTDQVNALGEGFTEMTIDLSYTSLGYFVQSYSKDTAKDFNDRNCDYITVMYTFSRDNIANKNNVSQIPVRVQIDEKNQMSVSIGREEKDSRAPLKIDLETNDTFKKSLWPYV